ncbi:uncharacterized protein [Triticum aestivum]|uniref:uncharacterized protein isoform X2 n=1 Tax=Triticum aestivum TaxID=4565 RepID=UPI001D01A368|nr:uncharacterized protein LOC123163067 isoform X2 [Triticum aestivum]
MLLCIVTSLRHLLRLPRCPSHPCYTIPFGFGGCRRHKRKNIGWMSASLLARRFLQKERRPSSPCTQGLSCEPMDLEEIIDETLLAGKQEVKEHSDSCSEAKLLQAFQQYLLMQSQSVRVRNVPLKVPIAQN